VFALFPRLLLPSVGAYFLAFVAMGMIAQSPEIQAVAHKHIPMSPSPHAIRGSALEAARDLQGLVWHYLTHQPEVCTEGRAINEFQRSQCREFASRLQTLGWLAVLPLGVAAFVGFFFFDGVRLRFARARARLRDGPAYGRGVVTHPANGPSDFFSWWLGVTPITVQGAEGRQIVAYLPPEMPMPQPGAQVTLFEWGKWGGKKRYFAVLYAPHLAVLHGA
jgi:hypothetical protein